MPRNALRIIGKVPDAAARGVICPMVDTADQARALVDACYPNRMRAAGFGLAMIGSDGVFIRQAARAAPDTCPAAA